MSYDKKNDRFILKPAKSSRVYSFCRKNISGSEGRFYCCDVTSMVSERPTKYLSRSCDGRDSSEQPAEVHQKRDSWC